MSLEVGVLVTCPEDGWEGEPQQAVLRVSDTALALWRAYRLEDPAVWLRQRFRPFRGPWPLQLLLTPLLAPTILFGRRDVTWAVEGGRQPCLRITPFVPAEFWVDIHFRSEQDRAAVAGLIGAFWGPRQAGRGAGPFLRRWWQAVGIAVFLASLAPGPLAGVAEGWIGFALFASYVLLVMVVGGVSFRRDRPPQGHGERPAGADGGVRSAPSP